MSNETLIPIEKYAAQQRMSIYNVMQKANRGEIKAVVKETEGKKKTFVVLDGDMPAAPEMKSEAPKEEAAVDYKEEYERLQKELEAMKAMLDARDGK